MRFTLVFIALLSLFVDALPARARDFGACSAHSILNGIVPSPIHLPKAGTAKSWEPGRTVAVGYDETGQSLAVGFPNRANSQSLESAVVVSYEDGRIVKRVYDSKGEIVPLNPLVLDETGAPIPPEMVKYKREGGKLFAFYEHPTTHETVKVEQGPKFQVIDFKTRPDGTRTATYFDKHEGKVVELGREAHQHVVRNRPQDFQVYDPKGIELRYKDSLFENGRNGRATLPGAAEEVLSNRGINVGLDRPDFAGVVNSALVGEFEKELFARVRKNLGLAADAPLDFSMTATRLEYYKAISEVGPRMFTGKGVTTDGRLLDILKDGKAANKHLASIAHVTLARQGIPSQIANYPGAHGVEFIVKIEGYAVEFGPKQGLHRYLEYRDRALSGIAPGPRYDRLRARLEEGDSFIEIKGKPVGPMLEQ